MSVGAVRLRHYPGDKVHVACRSCERSGRFDKLALILQAGANVPLPELRLQIAEGLGCEIARKTRAGEWQPGRATCGIYYLELMTTPQKQLPGWPVGRG